MFWKNSGIETFQANEGRGKLHGFVENFFNLTGPKKLRRGTILCFRKFLVGKKTDGFSEKNLNFFLMVRSGNFAVECDWNCKTSQVRSTYEISFFFWTKFILFFKERIFFKIATCGKVFLECVSNGTSSWKMSNHLIFEVFLQKSEKKI